MSGDVVARASRLTAGVDSGRWDVVREQGEFYGVYVGEFGRRVAGLIYDRREAEFIAAARSLVPELVDEIERKSAQLAEWIAQYRDREAEVATLETERDQWKVLWQENTRQASAALAERDAANAEVEKLRGALETIRGITGRNAIGARARGDSTAERIYLDVSAVIERAGIEP